jgi:3'-phosphoadenosine 5'-phosphosulfate (PAPS) 3'-phosphatase
MSLKLNEISEFLSFAKKLVGLSEQIIKKNSPQKLKINFKYDKSPVTKIDTAIEKN